MKKALIKKKDYEIYSIPMPVKILLGRHRNRFLMKEIEKRHPCFSLANCFDTKFSLKGKKLNADVVVMEKSRLLEYRNLFPAKTFALEDKEDRTVFGKKENLAKILIFLLIGAGIFSGFSIGSKLLEKQDFRTAETFVKSPEPKEEYVVLAPQEYFMLVFSSVNRNEGKINSMQWTGNTCQFDIWGCSSEDVAGARFCQVSYSKGEPNFTLRNEGMKIRAEEYGECREKLEGFDEFEISDAWGNELTETSRTFIPAIRKQLLRYGNPILSERSTETFAEISFIAEEDNFSSAMNFCATAGEEFGFREVGISISQSDLYTTVKVAFEKKNDDFEKTMISPLKVCGSYPSLFCPKKIFTSDSFVVKKTPVQSEKTLSVVPRQSSKTRLGSIVAKDGRVFAYYKSSEGKILMEEEIAN